MVDEGLSGSNFIVMVDEGLSGSLDWHEQSLKNNTLPRTLGILWILSERLKVEK